MKLYITTSWDDGHQLDMRLADMLNDAGLKGTFYICRDYVDAPLDPAAIRELADSHEIGAHTLTHPILTRIPLDEAVAEITGSKAWLEDMLGHEVTAFCYPTGRSHYNIQQKVKEAGYKVARGVSAYSLDAGDNPYNLPTTLHLYPYPLRPMPKLAKWRGWSKRSFPLRHAVNPIVKYRLSPLALRNWQSLARALLRKAARDGGVWHLWGHSWEIDEYGLWDELEALLAMIKRYKFQAITNSEIPDLMPHWE